MNYLASLFNYLSQFPHSTCQNFPSFLLSSFRDSVHCVHKIKTNQLFKSDSGISPGFLTQRALHGEVSNVLIASLTKILTGQFLVARLSIGYCFSTPAAIPYLEWSTEQNVALDQGTEHSRKGEILVNSGREGRVRFGQEERGWGEVECSK